MLLLARTVIGVASDVLRLILSFLYSSGAIRAQNLVLRKQLSSSIERGIKPRRADHATRVSLALFSRLFDWRDAVVIVRPSTVVRWHRWGWADLLAPEMQGTTTDSPGTAHPDSTDGHREPVVGEERNAGQPLRPRRSISAYGSGK
jgi:hypothetical protein